MRKSNEINKSMTDSQALSTCIRELNELKSYLAIDYELTEDRYGSKKISYSKGQYCSKCPVFARLGRCSIRSELQDLAEEHRGKYELAGGGGPGNHKPVGGIDGWYDSGWRQTG